MFYKENVYNMNIKLSEQKKICFEVEDDKFEDT